MSCDYNVHCLDCADTCSFSDANHQDKLMHSLIKHRDAIAALAPLARDADVELMTPYGRVSPNWFAAHAGHRLAVKDEYGRISEQKCSGCGEQSDSVRQVIYNWPHRLYCEACQGKIERSAG